MVPVKVHAVQMIQSCGWLVGYVNGVEDYREWVCETIYLPDSTNPDVYLGDYYGEGGGGSTTIVAKPAPESAAAITCSDDLNVRIENAQHAAAHYGLRPLPSQRGRTITIQRSTGTTETYRNTGTIGTGWMLPVPGTCHDA